ncbi:unnamed protein product [Vitrella brassicaformis CCMP3155]|uniref:Uncharacterized protein n=1 Tax=Vitrella brassicaformis (strain CCMP3155) TaxID=1169540 RepID=A0A0G4H558_VITBC|nr:unnamed protein product [Vitrella brassicaformis CCMP3155]|eukprot:CEM38916.1 unnamed protein product [Vitrella brassicaformis CCMP3155]
MDQYTVVEKLSPSHLTASSRRHYRSFRDSAFRLETIPEDHELTAAISTPSTSTTPSTDIRVIIPPFSCISHKGPPTPPARTNDPSADDSKGTKGGWGGGGDLVSETGVEWAKVTLRVVIVCCLLVGLLMVLLPNAWRLVPSLTPSAADRSFMRVSLAFLEQHVGVEGVGEVAGLKALRGPGS